MFVFSFCTCYMLYVVCYICYVNMSMFIWAVVCVRMYDICVV